MNFHRHPLILAVLLAGMFAGYRALGIDAQSLGQRFKVVGVIAGQGDDSGEGDIAVIKDTASNRTLVLRAGQQLPQMPNLTIASIQNKNVTVTDGETKVQLTYRGFSGYDGSYASRGSRRARRGDYDNHDEYIPGITDPIPPPTNIPEYETEYGDEAQRDIGAREPRRRRDDFMRPPPLPPPLPAGDEQYYQPGMDAPQMESFPDQFEAIPGP